MDMDMDMDLYRLTLGDGRKNIADPIIRTITHIPIRPDDKGDSNNNSSSNSRYKKND